MPRFDVFQTVAVDGLNIAHSKVRIGGDDAVKAAVNWVKIHGFFEKAVQKNVRILGNSTKEITARYKVMGGDSYIEFTLIPVENAARQCELCGWPKEAPNANCSAQCEDWRQNNELVLDEEEAEEFIRSAF